jgi:LacI family transcriptional regulator
MPTLTKQWLLVTVPETFAQTFSQHWKQPVITIREVAERAGVSTSTVSHVINETRYVSADVQARVRLAMAELGYQPNALARSLRVKRSNTLGMIVPEIAGPFFAEIVRAVEQVAFDRGYSLFLCNSDGDLEKERLFTNGLVEKQVDGLVFVAVGASVELVERLLARDVPVVVIDRELPGVDVDVVLADNLAGGKAAAEHLAALGHRRIACITGPSVLTLSAQRVIGYRELLAERELPYEERLVVRGRFDYASGHAAAKALLALPEPPTAVFACNDLMAIGAMAAAYAAGLRVPDDLSIIGFDNVPQAPYTNPPLTTIAQPIAAFGQAAIQMLLERIGDKGLAARRQVLSTQLVVRASTASPCE